MQDAVVLDGIRTPIGKHRGGLSEVRADDLAAHVLGALLARNENAKNALGEAGEVIFGATNQAGEDNRNVARMATLLAGLPYEVPAVTVNRLCGSGLEAVIQASRQIRLGEAEVMIAGGVESMTRAPYAMPKADEAFPRSAPTVYDTSLGWRFQNKKMEARFPLISMGETAENVAAEYNISRADQDAFALRSHQKAAQAWKNERFAGELAAVPLPAKKGETTTRYFEKDECVRADTTLESLAKLKPVFRKEGSVTAGNSSPLNDGASAVLIASAAWAKSNGQTPLAKIVASAAAGVHPNVMGVGPIPATQKLLQQTGLKSDEIDLIELNEAFAAQSLACVRTLGFDPERVNVNGGAIALGHPIGSSGARIVVSLAHEMKKRNARYGIATLCIGVGQGLALLLERN